MTNRTIGVSKSCMEVGRYVAFLAVKGIVFKRLYCGRCRWAATALNVTGEAFGTKGRVVTLD